MGGLPAFSIVVPTFNRPILLGGALSSLASLDYPRHLFEVIVVDDGGTADLDPVIDRFRARITLRCLRQPNRGAGAARNTGAAAAVHEYLAFTDDDCRPRADWLRALADALANGPDTLAGGLRINAVPENIHSTASQLILDVANAHFNRDPEHAVFFPSDNIAVPRRQFQALSGFDPSFRSAEDRDFCDRWAAQGWTLVHWPDAVVEHVRVMGLWGFCRQHFGYGQGAWRFHRARKLRRTGTFQVDGRFYLSCFRRPWMTERFWRALQLSGLLGIWQAANAAGYLYETMRHTASTLAGPAAGHLRR